MKRFILIAVAFLFALGVTHPPTAEARVGVYANFGCCYGGGYYPYAPYPAYYYPYAVAPPPVVYAVPPPSPIIYAVPTASYAAPAPAPVAPAATPASVPIVGSSSSPTFIDGQGRTCRQFQATSGGQTGTACLQPDGTWHAVQ